MKTEEALWKIIEARGFERDKFETKVFCINAGEFRPDNASVEMAYPHCAPVRCDAYRTTAENRIGALRGFIAWAEFVETQCQVVAHDDDGFWHRGLMISHRSYY